MSFSKVQLITA